MTLTAIPFIIPAAFLLTQTFGFWQLSWVLSNVLSLTFAVHAISEWQIAKITHIFGLYSVFFVYDITFVFTTDIMVSVAKAIDVPLKFVVPTTWQGQYSCVGLGDVIIPGLLISMAVRIDLFKAY